MTTYINQEADFINWAVQQAASDPKNGLILGTAYKEWTDKGLSRERIDTILTVLVYEGYLEKKGFVEGQYSTFYKPMGKQLAEIQRVIKV